MSKAEEYLKNNIKEILKPMVDAVLEERPKEQVNNNNIIYSFSIFELSLYSCFNIFKKNMI